MDYRNATPEQYKILTQNRIKANVTIDSEGCWIWNGARGPSDYGSIRYKGKTNTPHKVSYLVFNGPVPQGTIVRHSCNNKRCVNPEHLIIGSQAQNVHDTIEAGLFNKPRGSKHPNAKLTEDDVRSIRQLFKETDLGKWNFCFYQADNFGVSPGTILEILNWKKWKHVR